MREHRQELGGRRDTELPGLPFGPSQLTCLLMAFFAFERCDFAIELSLLVSDRMARRREGFADGLQV